VPDVAGGAQPRNLTAWRPSELPLLPARERNLSTAEPWHLAPPDAYETAADVPRVTIQLPQNHRWLMLNQSSMLGTPMQKVEGASAFLQRRLAGADVAHAVGWYSTVWKWWTKEAQILYSFLHNFERGELWRYDYGGRAGASAPHSSG
jgi:hypothetical protein